ncbi:MAG TPA: putative Ig domain-containing protein [Burkholderiaceae bacterium]
MRKNSPWAGVRPVLVTMALGALGTLSGCGGGSSAPYPSAVTSVTATSVESGAAAAAFTPVAGSNGTAPYTFSVDPALPTGMTLDAKTGAVSGTPAKAQAQALYSVTVSDVNAHTAMSQFQLTVTPGVVATTGTATVTTTAYAATKSVTPVTASSGTAPYSYSVSPALPTGLAFNTSTGAVSGMPTVIAAQATYTVTVKDAVASTATSTFNLVVNTPVITPLAAAASVPSTTLVTGPAITPFTPVTATGGFGSLAYVLSPALPAGLSFNATNGTISGAPTVTSAQTSYTVTVTDLLATSKSAGFTLTVNPGPIAASTAVANVSASTSAALTPVVPVTAAGGVPPYTYTVTAGAGLVTAPALTVTGLSFDSSTGTLSGTTAATIGSAPYTVTVTDSTSATSSSSFELTALPYGYVLSGGLTWLAPANTTVPHAYALNTLCVGTINGMTGWRLPTVVELTAFYAATKNSTGTGNSYLASLGWSTSSAYYWASDAGTSSGSFARINIGTGSNSSQGASSSNYATCVR